MGLRAKYKRWKVKTQTTQYRNFDVDASDISWEQLSGITQQMCTAAENQDWETLTALEKKREPILKQYFTSAQKTLAANIIRSQIQHIQYLDSGILEICLQHKDKTLGEMSSLQKGKTAGQAYLSNTGR